MCHIGKSFDSKKYSHSLIGFIDKDFIIQLKSGEIRAFTWDLQYRLDHAVDRF